MPTSLKENMDMLRDVLSQKYGFLSGLQAQKQKGALALEAQKSQGMMQRTVKDLESLAPYRGALGAQAQAQADRTKQTMFQEAEEFPLNKKFLEDALGQSRYKFRTQQLRDIQSGLVRKPSFISTPRSMPGMDIIRPQRPRSITPEDRLLDRKRPVSIFDEVLSS